MTTPGRRRSLSASLLWTVASNVAVPLSALLTGPLLARELGLEGRGELAAVLSTSALAVLLLTFGIPESLTYHVAARRLSRRTAVRAALALGAACGVAAALLLLATGPLVLRRFPDTLGLLYAIAATLPIAMALGMLRHVAQGMQWFELPNRERWLSIVARVALLVAFAVAGALTVTSAAWSTHGTAALATLLLLPVILRARRGSEDEGPARPLREVVRPVTSFGLKLWPGTLSGIIILRLDQVLIAPFAGAGELGLFAVAVSVAELPATALVAVRDIVFAASTDRQSPTLVAHATRVVVLVTVPICAAGILVAPFVVPLLFGDDFRGAVGMSQILLAAAVPSGVGMILSGGLLGIGRPGTASAVQVTAAAVTVIGLVVTVPIFGAIAAAWTALGSRLLSAVLATYAIVRHTDLGVAECVVPRMADARDLGERLRALLRR